MNTRNNLYYLQRMAIVLLALLPMAIAVQAQEQFWVNGIHYAVDQNYDDEYGWWGDTRPNLKVIAATGSSYSGEITIPEQVTVCTSRYNGSHYGGDYNVVCRVTGIGEDAFRDCTGLTAIHLPKSLLSICRNAFYGCTGLSEITIPYGVKVIDESAFANCTGLTSIELPNSVTSLGWNAFYSCTGLTNVTLSKSIAVLNGALRGCTALTAVTIPANVKTLIGAFEGCTGLTSVSLPKTLAEVGENTFAGCTALASVYLPNSVTIIGNRAFAGTALTTLELPSTIISLGENAFEGCTRLTSVTSRNLNPPAMDNEDVFEAETYGTAALYVPAMSATTYSNAYWWNLFGNVEGKAEYNNNYDFEDGGIYYIITGANTVSVTYRDTNYNSYSGSVTIPASVTRGGVTYSVTAIGTKAFMNCSGLTAVSMPASVTTIGNEAFRGCSGLTAITIPEAVTAIGNEAFFNCAGLTSLTIPEAVTFIGENAFYGTNGLTSLVWNARECWSNGNMTTNGITTLTIGNEVKVIPSCLAYQAPITALDIPLSVIIIDKYAFYNCSGLTELTIPLNVTTIGINAFNGTSELTTLVWNARECWTNGNMTTYAITSLTIGDEVQVIPSRLADNARISTLDIPSSVIHIGDYAFYYCYYLNSLVIPDNVVSIGHSAFADCYNINELTIGKSVTWIDQYAFNYLRFETLHWNARHVESLLPVEFHNPDYFSYDEPTYAVDFTSMTTLTIGDEVEILPDGFARSSRLSSVEIPAPVQSIGNKAFTNCPYLTSVTLPATMTTIGDEAFKECYSLETINFSNSLTTIGAGAFQSCGSLTTVDFPNSLTTIGAGAFEYCNYLTAVNFPNSLTTIGAEAFSYCRSFKNLFIPASVTSFGTRAFTNCDALESIVVDAANPVYDSRDNCNAMFKTANDSLILICKNTTLPTSMTVIPDSAFYGQTTLRNIQIPPTVTSIGKDAFNGCTGLTDITIPASVTHIGERAFANCSYITSLAVENGNTVYDSRDNCNAIIETASNTLIEGCRSTVIPSTVETIGKYAFMGHRVGDVTIPDGVVTICDSAFYNNNIVNLTLGNTLETIGNYAFYRNRINAIVIPNSMKTIGNRAFYGNSGTVKVLTLGNSLETIGTAAFEGCLTREMMSNSTYPEFYPDYSTYYDYYDEQTGEYMTIYYDAEGDFYIIYGPDGETYYTGDEYRELTSPVVVETNNVLTIPASLQTLGASAFSS